MPLKISYELLFIEDLEKCYPLRENKISSEPDRVKALLWAQITLRTKIKLGRFVWGAVFRQVDCLWGLNQFLQVFGTLHGFKAPSQLFSWNKRCRRSWDHEESAVRRAWRRRAVSVFWGELTFLSHSLDVFLPIAQNSGAWCSSDTWGFVLGALPLPKELV